MTTSTFPNSRLIVVPRTASNSGLHGVAARQNADLADNNCRHFGYEMNIRKFFFEYFDNAAFTRPRSAYKADAGDRAKQTFRQEWHCQSAETSQISRQTGKVKIAQAVGDFSTLFNKIWNLNRFIYGF